MSKITITNQQGPINNLPDGMISRILKCLPLEDVAKLCIVSRSWLTAWKELPELKFDAQFFAKVLKGRSPTTDEFFNFLSIILLSHVGPIHGFYLFVPLLKSTSAPDIGPWICYLSRNDVKEITITNMHQLRMKLSYHFFSCLTLEKLKLDGCVLNVLPYFKVFRYLKSIELVCVTFMGNSFTDFIARCPVLQSLTLKQCLGFERIHITAPNLKYLYVSGKFEAIYLRRVENLVSFSAVLQEMVPNYQNARACELLAYLAHPCKIEKLSFGGHFCKVKYSSGFSIQLLLEQLWASLTLYTVSPNSKLLTAGRVGAMVPTCYRYLKSLLLSNIETDDADTFSWVFRMIKSCLVLEDLQITFSSKDSAEHAMAYDPCYRMYHLRKVHLTSVTGVTMELKLIKFLLCCSPALETMYVKRGANIKKVLRSRLARELMFYPRISPKATVVYLAP